MDDPKIIEFCDHLARHAFSRELLVDPYGRVIRSLRHILAVRDIRCYFAQAEPEESRLDLLETLTELRADWAESDRHCDDFLEYLDDAIVEFSDGERNRDLCRDLWADEEVPASVQRVPSMIDADTKRYYHWLTRNLQTEGYVVDLGCWLGGSTMCLAEGLSRNPHVTNPLPVKAYDLFHWQEWMGDHIDRDLERSIPKEGDDFLDLFWKYCDSQRSRIEAVRWSGFNDNPPQEWDYPIAAVVFDVAQDYSRASKLWSWLRPGLIPHQSVFVTNTYGSPRSHLLRRFLRDHAQELVPIHKPRSSTKGFLFQPPS